MEFNPGKRENKDHTISGEGGRERERETEKDRERERERGREGESCSPPGWRIVVRSAGSIPLVLLKRSGELIVQVCNAFPVENDKEPWLLFSSLRLNKS